MTKQIHLAAHFPGVNNTTVWSDPRSGSHIEFSSFAHLARTAERAKFLTRAKPGTFEHRDAQFDISGQFNVPRGPQGRPVIFQAGDSEEGREFAASSADAIFSRHGTLTEG